MILGTFFRQEVCQVSQIGQVWQKRFLEQQNNIFGHPYGSYIVDVLCRQPIKLIHFVSTSEVHEY